MDFHLKNPEYIIKSGAIISTIGVIMLILFGSILLIFPVSKICEKNCVFISTAPTISKTVNKSTISIFFVNINILGSFSN